VPFFQTFLSFPSSIPPGFEFPSVKKED